MTNEEAVAVLSTVTKRWHKSSLRGEGSKREIARQYWSDHGVAQPFEDWFKEMINVASSVNKTMAKANGADDSDSLKAKYRDLAMKHNQIAPDAVLAQAWGAAARGTLSSIRTRLKQDEGFDFQMDKAGTYKVTKRPPAPPKKVPAGAFADVECCCRTAASTARMRRQTQASGRATCCARDSQSCTSATTSTHRSVLKRFRSYGGSGRR